MVVGCDYERFSVIVGSDFYHGRIMTHHSDVEVGEKRILLRPGARVAFQTHGMTQSVAQLDIDIVNGDGIVAYVRTVPNAFDTAHGIALRYSTSGCWVRTDDSVIVPVEYNADPGPQTIKLYNEAEVVRFDAGCRVLHEQATTLPATEYLIIEALPESTVEIRAIKFFSTTE
jgi:hypothetical protein